MLKNTTEEVRTLVRVDESMTRAPYASAAIVGNQVWTSGAVPARHDGSVPREFKSQVRTALENLEASLKAAGADFGSVVKITGYVANIRSLPDLDEVYVEMVGPYGLPPRTIVEVAGFRGKCLVEFDAVAVRSGERG